MTAKEATLRRVCRAFDSIAAWVPQRIADEEIGDAVEEIAARVEAERCSWCWLTGKVLSTIVLVAVHAFVEPAPPAPGEQVGLGVNMFDRYVTATRPSRKRRSWMVASLGLHGAAAIALIVYSFARVDEIGPPPLSLIFFGAQPSPQAGGSTSSERSEPKVKKPTAQRKKTALVQPTATPTPPEAPESTAHEIGDPTTPPGNPNLPPGIPDRPPGGGPLADGRQIDHFPPPPPPKPRNIVAHQLDAEAIFHPDPHLPDIVKLQHTGLGDPRFTAKVCVDQGGGVSRVQIVEGIPGGDASILGTIRSWRYKPQPIPVCFVATWVFHIQ